MKPRRKRVTSRDEAVRIMRGANIQVVPPSTVPLDKGDIPFFVNIVEEFAKADWTPHQLELAALLARSMNDFAVEQMLLRDEGAVIQAEMGPKPNPRKVIMNMHAQNILSFRRSLALHAAAKGKLDDIAKRSVVSHDIQAHSPLNDGLIARA